MADAPDQTDANIISSNLDRGRAANRITARVMQPYMVRIHPFLNTNAQVRHLRVSLPLIGCLVDRHCYFLPDDLPPPAGGELRALVRPRITRLIEPRRRAR